MFPFMITTMVYWFHYKMIQFSCDCRMYISHGRWRILEVNPCKLHEDALDCAIGLPVYAHKRLHSER